MKPIVEAMTRLSGEWGTSFKTDGAVVETPDETPVLTISGPKRNASLAAADVVVFLSGIPLILEALKLIEEPSELKAFVSVDDVKELIAKEIASLEPSPGSLFESKGEVIKLIRQEIDFKLGEHLEKGHLKF